MPAMPAINSRSNHIDSENSSNAKEHMNTWSGIPGHISGIPRFSMIGIKCVARDFLWHGEVLPLLSLSPIFTQEQQRLDKSFRFRAVSHSLATVTKKGSYVTYHVTKIDTKVTKLCSTHDGRHIDPHWFGNDRTQTKTHHSNFVDSAKLQRLQNPSHERAAFEFAHHMSVCAYLPCPWMSLRQKSNIVQPCEWQDYEDDQGDAKHPHCKLLKLPKRTKCIAGPLQYVSINICELLTCQ